MILTFTKSFERSLHKSDEKEKAKEASRALLHSFESGVRTPGFGLKKLREDLWEIRAGIKTRVLFSLLPGEIRLLLVGNHDEVKQYLRAH